MDNFDTKCMYIKKKTSFSQQFPKAYENPQAIGHHQATRHLQTIGQT